MRTALIAAALVAVVVGAALAAVPALLDPRILLTPVKARAADAGLTLTVRGEPRIEALWRPALELDGFELRNDSGEVVLSAEAVRAELDLIDLLTGEAVLRSLDVGDATMPLDAAQLANLDGLAPRGVESVGIARGVFSASGNEIQVRQLELHRDPERGARLEGFAGPEGEIRVEASLAPGNSEGMRPAALSLTPRDAPDAPPYFAIEARLGAGDDGWLIDDARMAMPGLELAGDGVLRTGERWYASLGLSAEDGSLEGLDSLGLVRAVDLASRLAKVELLFRLDSARWRGGTVRDLQADLVADDGTAEITALVATLPGQTTLSLSGKAGPIAGPGAALAGTALADTGDPAALLSWLGAPSPWKPEAAPRHAVLDVGYRLDADTLALDPLTARWEGTTIKGRLSVGRDRPRIEAALGADSIDLAAFERPAWLLPVALRPFEVGIDVKSLSMGQRLLGPLHLSARGGEGRIELEELTLPDLADMSLSLSGTASGIPDALEVDLDYAATGDIDAAWALAGITPPAWLRQDGALALRGTLSGAPERADLQAELGYGDLSFTAQGGLGVAAGVPEYDVDIVASRSGEVPVDMPFTVTGDDADIAMTAERGTIGGIPVGGRMTLGLDRAPMPVDLDLRSEVAPLLDRLGGEVEATGALTVRFAGTALRDAPSLAEALEGEGLLTVRKGSISGFDVAALDRAVAGTDGATGLINLVAELSSDGVTRIRLAEIPFTLRQGRAEIQDAVTDADGADMETAGVVELPSRRVDLHTRMTLDSATEAPPIALDVRGRWGNLRARLDFNALQRYLLDGG